MKRAFLILFVVVTLSGCKKTIPPEARVCAKAAEILISTYPENLVVTGISPISRLEGNLVSITLTGEITKGIRHIIARCELYQSGKDFDVNRWWLTSAGPDFSIPETQVSWDPSSDGLLLKAVPFTFGVSFKADGFAEESFGVQWYNH